MLREGSHPIFTMKSQQKIGFDRFDNHPGRGAGAAEQRKHAQDRNDGLVLLAIAILFLANVVLYLCHHYGLTSLNDWRPQTVISARVVTD